MTAIKPTENRLVRGVPSERYPLNHLCSHPQCGERAADPHHIFPRSLIGNDSWFVEIQGMFVQEIPQPHVTGLCRPHHDDVEQHAAWIKLEDGQFNWYERTEPSEDEKDRWEAETGHHRDDYPVDEWLPLGPLDPQPCKGEKAHKPKRESRDPRRQRKTITLRVPVDSEDGAALFYETVDQVKDRLFLLDAFAERETMPSYEAIMAALRDWLDTTRKEAMG